MTNTPTQALIDELIAQLREGDLEKKHEASEVLAGLGEAAVMPLIEVLRSFPTVEDFDRDMNTHSQAEEVLIKIGEPAVEPLIDTLREQNWGARYGAILCLGRIGDARAIQPIIEAWATEPDDGNYYTDAHDALEQFGKRALPSLIDALHHSHPKVRIGAAQTLGHEGLRDPLAVPTLIRVFETDLDLNVRLAAASSLKRSGDGRAVEPLIAALHDASDELREGIVSYLGELMRVIPSPRGIDALAERMRTDSDWGTRQSAAEKLVALNNTHYQEEALALLLADLENSEPDIRLGAGWSLLQLKDKRAVEPLVRLLYQPDTSIVYSAVLALGKFGDERALAPLIGMVEHQEIEVVRIATYALGELRDSRAIPVLEGLAASHPDQEVRERAAHVLRVMGNDEYQTD